jgi:hypothetical protein
MAQEFGWKRFRARRDGRIDLSDRDLGWEALPAAPGGPTGAGKWGWRFKPLGLALLISASCFAQADDYSPEKENVLLKTRAGKQLFKEDVQCGNYFWISVKAAVNGAPVLYYFYGDPAFGKNKVGLYRQDLYRVVVAGQQDPPTVQVIRGPRGAIDEIRVRMTASELESSRACFP